MKHEGIKEEKGNFSAAAQIKAFFFFSLIIPRIACPCRVMSWHGAIKSWQEDVIPQENALLYF
jgi:hypothetical protein